jgi:hypothetical protein
METDYAKYRGKCKGMCEAAIAADPSLTLVRGYYFCPIWNSDEPHWWTKRSDGTIFDPTAKQFGSKGHGIYTEFDGTIECAQCGRSVDEKEAVINGNYACCSNSCMMRFVGL